jgi:hypothetical protein
MGQYHTPVCIEAEEALDQYKVGCGAKEGEQGYTRPGVPAALVALLCARGGNRPADCSQSPLVGRWAGKRVLIQGDYVEDGDIPNWDGPPLSSLYGKIDEDWTDVGDEAAAFLEAACNVRFFGDGWRNFVRVQPVARHFGNNGVADYVLAKDIPAEKLAYLKRAGMRPIDVQRAPRSRDWHGIRPEEMAEGHKRVIVNLDTLEYLDPFKFGQVPTLAAMVNLAPADRSLPILAKASKGNECLVDIAGGLFVMLCHPERRGGGDIPANAEEMKSINPKAAGLFKGVEDVKGRWRGGHILGTSEIRYENWPTTEEVIERGTDISDRVIRYLVAISHY